MTDKYRLAGKTTIPKEFEDLIRRRVRPFMDPMGLQTKSLQHLMSEAYRQGFIDAVEASQKPQT